MRFRRMACLLGAAAAFGAAAAPASALDWSIEDIPGGADDLSLDLDFNGPCIPGCSPTPGDPGRPVVATEWLGVISRFVPVGDGALGAGVSTALQGRPDVPGEVSLVVDPGGTTAERGHIRFAGTVTLDSNQTQLQYFNADYDEINSDDTVDLVPGVASITGVSIAVSGTGAPVVSYQRRVGATVEVVVARRVDGAWSRTVVDQATTGVLGDTALELTPTGAFRLLYHLGGVVYGLREGEPRANIQGPNPCTVYGDLDAEYDAAGDELRGAFTQDCDGQQALYYVQTVEGGTASNLVEIGSFDGTSMDVDAFGRPHFAWVQDGRLRYQAFRDPTEDVAAASPQATSLRIDRNGAPHIAFVTGDQARYAVQGAPSCRGKAPTIVGTPGADTITGTFGPDVIAGLAGNDVIRGGGGDDVICGGEGNDTLYGSSGNDELFGFTGSDTLNGENGNDHLIGDGDPVFEAKAMPDKLNGGNGDDLLEDGAMQGVKAAENDRMIGGDGNDTLLDVGGGADYLETGGGTNTAIAGPGADTVNGGALADLIDAGEDNDVVNAGGGADRVEGNTGNDRLTGGDGDDLVRGNDGADTVYGNAGADQLFGDAGTDQLFGGTGNDALDGGTETDRCDQGGGTGPLTSCNP